jgi:membrane protein
MIHPLIVGVGKPRPRAEIPHLSYLRAIGSATRHFLNDDSLIIAGYLAFTGIFALFPFIIFLLSLAGFIGQTEAAQESIVLALDLAPPEVVSALLPAIDQVRAGTTPGLLTFGIIVTLWVSSNGIEAARTALDRVYGTEEYQRNFVVARLQSIALTIVAAISILIAVVLIVAGPLIQDLLEWSAQRRLFNQSVSVIVRYTVGMSIFFALVVATHRLLPAARLRFRDVLPGSLLTVIVWAGAVSAYSWYLGYMGGYNLTYGSLGGIVLTLFFFYISAAIFIFGAQLNGALRRQRIRIARALADVSEASSPSRRSPAR